MLAGLCLNIPLRQWSLYEHEERRPDWVEPPHRVDIRSREVCNLSTVHSRVGQGKFRGWVYLHLVNFDISPVIIQKLIPKSHSLQAKNCKLGNRKNSASSMGVA